MERAMPAAARARPARPRRLLVLGRDDSHPPVPYAARALEILGRKTGAFEAVVTSDGSSLEPGSIEAFDGVLVNNWHGWSPFAGAGKERDALRRKALLDFVAGGKGIAGIHAAAVGLDDWPEYGEMLGGKYAALPWFEAAVRVEDPSHPVVAAFGRKSFRIADEIYELRAPYSRDRVRVLLSVDTGLTTGEKSTKYGKPVRTDGDYGLSWVKRHGEGRVFSCALGHASETYWNRLRLSPLSVAAIFQKSTRKHDP